MAAQTISDESWQALVSWALARSNELLDPSADPLESLTRLVADIAQTQNIETGATQLQFSFAQDSTTCIDFGPAANDDGDEVPLKQAASN